MVKVGDFSSQRSEHIHHDALTGNAALLTRLIKYNLLNEIRIL